MALFCPPEPRSARSSERWIDDTAPPALKSDPDAMTTTRLRMRRAQQDRAAPVGDEHDDLGPTMGTAAYGAGASPAPWSTPSQQAGRPCMQTKRTAPCRSIRLAKSKRPAQPLRHPQPPSRQASRGPPLANSKCFCPVSRAPRCSPGEPAPDENHAVQPNQGPSCPTARPPPVPLPLWSRLGPTCENASRVARQAELPAPPRFSRFPAHARGVPPLPPRRDKGTGGRAAGHKEALS